MRYFEIAESFGTVLNFDPHVDDTLFRLDLKASNGTITEEEITAFGRLLAKHKTDFIRLYHATVERHDVMGKGLLPTSAGRKRSLQSTPGYVYLAYDPRASINFARAAYAGEYGSAIVVYGVDVSVGRLLPDHDQLRNKRMWGDSNIGASLAHSLIYGHGARVKGKIESNQLHIWGKFDRHGHPID